MIIFTIAMRIVPLILSIILLINGIITTKKKELKLRRSPTVFGKRAQAIGIVYIIASTIWFVSSLLYFTGVADLETEAIATFISVTVGLIGIPVASYFYRKDTSV